MKINTAEILAKVKKIELKSGKLVSDTFSGQYLSVFKGKGIEFADVREYVPGDDIRDIDWNITARLRKPYVKKYDEERELTLLVACDVSASNLFGTSSSFKNETAAELSALFLFSALKNSDKTGLYLFSDKTQLYVPPKKGRNHILRIIREMLAFEPDSPGTNIAEALKNINKLLKRKAIIILISDFLDKDFEKAAAVTERKHDLIPVILSDKIEYALPKIPAVLNYKDAETGKKAAIDLSDPDSVNLYEQEAKKRREKLKSFFISHKIDFMEISAGEDIYTTVIDFFKKRKLKLRISR
ncbi:MAG: DUF58 domain-containing protein [Elusimicrobia bacterium]|nr:DUF58 domain-containing protein [Elusimicrobiota bacterium]